MKTQAFPLSPSEGKSAYLEAFLIALGKGKHKWYEENRSEQEKKEAFVLGREIREMTGNDTSI